MGNVSKKPLFMSLETFIAVGERKHLNRCFLWEMSARNHFLYHLNVVFSERKVLLSARPMPALACRPRRRIPVRAEKEREREREREREMFLFFSFCLLTHSNSSQGRRKDNFSSFTMSREVCHDQSHHACALAQDFQPRDHESRRWYHPLNHWCQPLPHPSLCWALTIF